MPEQKVDVMLVEARGDLGVLVCVWQFGSNNIHVMKPGARWLCPAERG